MRFLAILVTILLVPVVQAAAPHSDSVAGASHEPTAPNRGEDVRITLFIRHNATTDHVRLTYCRVQNYACARPLNMSVLRHGTWIATIPWNQPDEYRFADFWKGVTDVGYNFTLFHPDGRQETSPTVHYPSDPGGLAPDSHYYFYKLPPDPKGKAPALDAAMLLVAILAAVCVARRRA